MQISQLKHADFNAISVGIASPEQILDWSHGEIKKPETINYRTQKPERDGLFCERIFGPKKNWECYCGKYRKIKYKNVICEKCGVEVTRSVVRRERFGHIQLVSPVAHTWFLRSTPSRIGLMLDLSVKSLEQVVSFAAYIMKSVNYEEVKKELAELENEYKEKIKKIHDNFRQAKNEFELSLKETPKTAKQEEKARTKLDEEFTKQGDDLKEEYLTLKSLLSGLAPLQILSELDYVKLRHSFGHVFDAGIGAEALKEIISKINLEELLVQLKKDLKDQTGQKHKKTIKRIKLVGSLIKADIRPEWMIMDVIPVIPADLRPMVALDGGRFATSDLNDLYRRVINRNNRLKRLKDIGAPEVICRNEKRMLQEAVDALLNNQGHGGKVAFNAGDRRRYRSLSDMLKGKQGRFRQNLLGKRVDYSGRSVIVVNPKLKLHQCGLPKLMALELFKPFVLGILMRKGFAHNFKHAEKMIEWGNKEIWDALEEATKDNYVLLNRAPTLHRLGIQAFQPILIDGNAIQIHPLVCEAFNADFDGDQMAVHLPLGRKAQKEAKEILCSSKNPLKPASGEPVIYPSQDITWGCYFMTQIKEGKPGEGMTFANVYEAIYAYETEQIHIQAKIKVRVKNEIGLIETSVGRLMFNQKLPSEIGFRNEIFGKKALKKLYNEVYEKSGREKLVELADDVKDLGYYFVTESGMSISIFDFTEPKDKPSIISNASESVDKINKQYRHGFMTDEERYFHTIKEWSNAKVDIEGHIKEALVPEDSVHVMIDSGARADWSNITQITGMKGLVTNPSGKIIELPIQSSFMSGFSILEYFIAAHGGRKGKSDTALKTAQAGYLTRRLVDGVQDIIIREDDCGAREGSLVTKDDSDKIGEDFNACILSRTLLRPILDKKTGEIVFGEGALITKDVVRKITAMDVSEVKIRSITCCKTKNGICTKCYGADLSNHRIVEIGIPVGIIAAQAIGEPGTQLTMRTFHTGGVFTGEEDITQGLGRVEELFESRPPKTQAIIAEFDGKVKITKEEDKVLIRVIPDKPIIDKYDLYGGFNPVVEVGDSVEVKSVIAKIPKEEGKGNTKALHAGTVKSIDVSHIIIERNKDEVKEYTCGARSTLKVENDEKVKAGKQLTSGHINLRQLLKVTNAETVQRYILTETQSIYAAQGQTINDKHFEVITRQMLSKVRIVDSGESMLLPGEIIDLQRFNSENLRLRASGKTPAIADRLLLGLTRVSLATDSWLSAASFQETIRVLIEASVSRKVDKLTGLKENVIIGKIIPAGAHYRKKIAEEHIATAGA